MARSKLSLDSVHLFRDLVDVNVRLELGSDMEPQPSAMVMKRVKPDDVSQVKALWGIAIHKVYKFSLAHSEIPFTDMQE